MEDDDCINRKREREGEEDECTQRPKMTKTQHNTTVASHLNIIIGIEQEQVMIMDKHTMKYMN